MSFNECWQFRARRDLHVDLYDEIGSPREAKHLPDIAAIVHGAAVVRAKARGLRIVGVMMVDLAVDKRDRDVLLEADITLEVDRASVVDGENEKAKSLPVD